MARTTADLRAELLAACDRAGASSMRSDRRVRVGIRAGRSAIEETPLADDPVAWLARVRERLERERLPLVDDPDDEDGWALGGLATVRGAVESAHERARAERVESDGTLGATEALLRVAAAVRRAFPDRAEALLGIVEPWFRHEGVPLCTLCGRSIAGEFAGASGPAPDPGEVVFERMGGGERRASIALCAGCVSRAESDWPATTEPMLVDVLRALRAEDKDRNAIVEREVERRHAASAFRGLADARCWSCGTEARMPVGREPICFGCLRAARSALFEEDELLGRRLAQDLRRALDSARAPRLAERAIVADPLVAQEADAWLTRVRAAEAREDLLAAIDALTARLRAGARVYRSEQLPYDDRTDAFRRLARFLRPDLAGVADTLAREAIAIVGGSAEARRHVAQVVHDWRDARVIADGGISDALWRVADGEGSSALADVPDGSTVFVGSLALLDARDRVRLAERPSAWLLIVGAPDLATLRADAERALPADLAVRLVARARAIG